MGITRKGTLIQEHILRQIETADYPLSSRQLAIQLGYSWNTVQQHCLELLVRKKLQRMETPGAHLWVVDGSYTKKKATAQEKYMEVIDAEIEKVVDELLEKETINLPKEKITEQYEVAQK